MPNGTDEQAGATQGVPFRSLPTAPGSHRTSEPTNRAVREAIARLTLARPGRRKPSADLVIFTALRLAQQMEAIAPGTFAAAADGIEAETFLAEGPS